MDGELGGQVYLSFSGGKDSAVLADLYVQVCLLLHCVPHLVYCDTGLEFLSVRKFVDEYVRYLEEKYDTTIKLTKLYPQKYDRKTKKYALYPFNKVITDYGYPVISKEQSQFIREYRETKSETLRKIRIDGNKYGRGKIAKRNMYLVNSPFKISEKCCSIMKKNPAKRFEAETGLHPIIGTMAEESQLRQSEWLGNGCNAFSASRPTSKPLSIWLEQDILKYIVDSHLPIAEAYGEIVCENGQYRTTKAQRTGCVFCMFGVQCEEEPNRFQRLKELEPKRYEYCMKSVEDGGLGLDNVLTYMNIPH